MRAVRWVAAALCLGLALSAVADEGRGSRSCRKWTEERSLAEGRKEMNKIPVLISKAWFLGFLAGRGGSGKSDFLGKVDNESVFLWLDNYCRDHAREDLAQAGVALERELLQGKGGGH